MIEKVLVGIDGSRAATSAAALAQTLAERLRLGLHAVFVVDAGLFPQPTLDAIAGSLGIAPSIAAAAAQARAGLEALGQELLSQVAAAATARRVSCRTELTFDRPARALLERSGELTLTVLGRSGTAHEDAGEDGLVIAHLLRHGTTPRLVVAEQAGPPQSLVCGFDDSPSARSVLHLSARLAQALGLPLTIAHVMRQASDPTALPAAREQLALFDGLRVTYEQHLGSPADVLVQRFGAVPGVVLALGARGHHRLADRLLGTTTERVHRACPATLLVDG